MAQETSIAKGVRTTDGQAQYDAACKRLLSEKIILANIMKSCLREYQDCDVNEIAEKYIEGQPQISEVPVEPDESTSQIQGLPNEDASLTEGKIFYDIRFFATAPSSGEQIRLIINLEAQNDFNPGYSLLKRGIYYCSRMISRQKNTEFSDTDYDKLKKVYSIWICMTPPKSKQNTITRYHMVEEQLVGESAEPEENYDLLSVISVCLGDPDSEAHSSVLRLLNILLSSQVDAEQKKQVLQNDFAIPMSREIDKEVAVMCNLSKGVKELGIQEGIKIGMERGIESGRIQSIKGLMDNMKWSSDQSMEALGIPEEQRKKYRELLQQQ